MTVNYTIEDIENIELSVRSILGVPEEILTDEVIDSPVFTTKANAYINKYIKEYSELNEDLLRIAFVYYICYLICPGMYSRLPKQMDNVSTKTILQSIDWIKISKDMIEQCDDALEQAIGEIDEGIDYNNSYAVLTDASDYPNTLI